jgi:hypothetical protein
MKKSELKQLIKEVMIEAGVKKSQPLYMFAYINTDNNSVEFGGSAPEVTTDKNYVIRLYKDATGEGFDPSLDYLKPAIFQINRIK